jgi:hypothetical protein
MLPAWAQGHCPDYTQKHKYTKEWPDTVKMQPRIRTKGRHTRASAFVPVCMVSIHGRIFTCTHLPFPICPRVPLPNMSKLPSPVMAPAPSGHFISQICDKHYHHHHLLCPFFLCLAAPAAPVLQPVLLTCHASVQVGTRQHVIDLKTLHPRRQRRRHTPKALIAAV